jgi:hypothetical protein
MGARGAGSRRASFLTRAVWAVAVLGVTFLLMFSCNAHNAMGAFEAAIALLSWSLLYGALEYWMRPSSGGRQYHDASVRRGGVGPEDGLSSRGGESQATTGKPPEMPDGAHGNETTKGSSDET